jgi:hypothetical protein
VQARQHNKPGRPSSSESAAGIRDILAGQYSFILEADGIPTEAAIAQSAGKYNVSRSKMFECRANLLTGSGEAEQLARFQLGRWKNNPEVRRRVRQALEKEAESLFEPESS